MFCLVLSLLRCENGAFECTKENGQIENMRFEYVTNAENVMKFEIYKL